MDKRAGKVLASSASGGAATARGVEYQMNYAVRLTLVLLHEHLGAPHVAHHLTMEPRRVSGSAGTAWDICTHPDQRLIEAKLRPTADDVKEWLVRIRAYGLHDTTQFDLVYSDKGGRLDSLRRRIRIAQEASDEKGFHALVAAEALKDDFGVAQVFGKDAYQYLSRIHVVQCPEHSLSSEINLQARFLVGDANHQRVIDFLYRKLSDATSRRLTVAMADLIEELRSTNVEVFKPPQLSYKGLDPLAIECLFGLRLLRDPLPMTVLAAANNVAAAAVFAVLRPILDAKLISMHDGAITAGPAVRNGFKLPDPASTTASLLDALLDYVAKNKDKAIQQLRNISVLANEAAKLRPKPVARSFQIVDKALKQLGDKHEVLKAAKLAVEAARRTNEFSQRTRDVVGWEAQALICGVSWVMQRIGRLPEARIHAQRSLELGESIHWDRNTAFCKKCIGRLCRMEGEAEQEPSTRAAHFARSLELLQQAIDGFSRISDIGPNGAEVGDCYSLIGRTLLSMGRLDDANYHADKAFKLLSDDQTSKDYIDLIILFGDIEAGRKNYRDAITRYDEAISASEGQGVEITEMLARVLRQRAFARKAQGQSDAAISDFQRASEIWTSLGENELAALARWEIWLISNQPAPATKQLLAREAGLVRMNAVESYEASAALHAKRAAARREDPGVDYWRRQIKLAKEKSVIEDIVW